jgi:glycosyltransferase involved in cell wall biosynthesis
MPNRIDGSRPGRVLMMVENVALARDERLRKQVGALVSEGYRVSVICPRDPANRECGGVRIRDYRAPTEAGSKLGFVREYAYSWVMAAGLATRAFLREGFDAIQISGVPDIYFTIGRPFQLLGKPLVLDQRDVAPELYEARYGRRGPVYRVLRLLERASYRTADHVVTVNAALEKIAYTRGGLPAGTVTVVGNGPVVARTYRRPPRPELKHGRPLLCCWLGVMGPQDSVDVALHAVHRLVHELGRTDCHFAFVGDGEVRPDLERLARDLRITDWVSFPGWVEEEEVYTYLSTADLGIEPNLEDYISPVKVMEYMAFALPFVTFDLTETRTLADDAAAYAPPGDVPAFAALVDRLLDQPTLRREMGRAGRRRVEDRLAWDHQQAAYLKVYERLLGRPVAGAARLPAAGRQGS